MSKTRTKKRLIMVHTLKTENLYELKSSIGVFHVHMTAAMLDGRNNKIFFT
jgi:hypothetical protein